MSQRLYTLPLSAHDVAHGLIAIARELPSPQIEFAVSTAIPNIDIRIQQSIAVVEQDGNVKRFLKDMKERPELPCYNATLKTTQQQPGQPTYSLLYKTEGTITYFTIEQTSDRAVAIKLLDALRATFNITSRATVLGASLPPEDQEAIRYREQAVADLKAQIERLANYLAQIAEKNAETVRTITSDLEKQYQQKSAALEERIVDQQKRLDTDKAEFDRQRKEFDDRQRTHVRRDLLQRIETNIESRRSASIVTKNAERSRLYIHSVSAAVIILSAVAMVFSGHHLYQSLGDKPFDWRVVPPFSLAAIVFSATLVFYFRWISRWADRLAHNDLAAVQYASDILRASWIAELLFEYKEEKGTEIPAEVLASLTEGLFKREEFRAGSYHPSDDLSLLAKRIKTFKAGPEGIEVTAGSK